MRRQRTLRVGVAARFALMCPSLRTPYAGGAARLTGISYAFGAARLTETLNLGGACPLDLRSRLGAGNKDCSAASPLRVYVFHNVCVSCEAEPGRRSLPKRHKG